MLCFIYRSKRWDGAYLYLKNKDDFTFVPEPLLKQFGSAIFVMALSLSPKRKLAMIESDELEKALADKGYYFQLTPDIFTKMVEKNES